MSQSAAEVPKPPEDPELRNIIEKLAQFVAKNGSEFENMTKQKQKDNPRFSFLYGGEHCHYYMYRVSIEQALARKRQQTEQQQNTTTETKMKMLQAQIIESERNLKAQYDVLMKQQETDVNEAVRAALERQIYQVALELRLNIQELAGILDRLAYPYAQEGQEAAVSWILAHYSTPKHGELLIRYLLERVKDPREYFQRKLSILYVVVNLGQRSVQEQHQHMAELLRRFAPVMIAFAMKLHGQQDERSRQEFDQLIRAFVQTRLLADIGEWMYTKYEETLVQYQSELRNEYAEIVAEVAQRIQNQYRQYEIQHHEYARHIQQQITGEQYQQQQHLQQQQAAMMASQSMQSSGGSVPGASGSESTQPQVVPTPTQPRRSRFDDAGPAGGAGVQGAPLAQPPPPPSVINPLAPPGASPWQQPPPMIAAAIVTRPPQPGMGGVAPPPGGYTHPPPPFQHGWPPPTPQSGAPGAAGPWLSGHQTGPPSGPPFGPALPPPPPGVCVNVSQPPPMPPAQTAALTVPSAANVVIDEQALIPKVAYYDLPAGLMAPLIKLEDHEYAPLKPEELRLPAPLPPSDRLIAAVEAFYAPANHENPRDSDGWERLGLYEYYKEKGKAMQRATSSSRNRKNSSDDSSDSPPSHDRERKKPSRK